MNPREIKEIINSIPKECNPRIGGSCNLFYRGLVDHYRDVDIIIDKGTINKVNLPFHKIESLHGEGLNKRIKYCINGREVNILESICPKLELEKSLMGIYFEPEGNVYLAKRLIVEYLESLKQISKRGIKNKGRADSQLSVLPLFFF